MVENYIKKTIRYINKIKRIFVNRELDDLGSHLVQGTVGTLVLKTSGTGLMFAVSVILTRLLNADGYGIYAYAMACCVVLSIPANLGINHLLVREVAFYQSQSLWGLLKGIMVWGRLTVLISSLIVALLSASVVLFLYGAMTPIALTFLVALLYLIFNSQNSLYSSVMQGLNRIILGQIPTNVIRPLCFLLLLGGLKLTGIFSISPAYAMGLNVAAAASALIVSCLLLNMNTPKEVFAAQTIYEPYKWLRSMPPFTIIGGMTIINNRAAVIMIGALIGTKSAGIFEIATRYTELASFILIAVNSPLGPSIASLHKYHKERLQRVTTLSVRIAFFTTLPLVICLIVFRYRFMFFFGPEFVDGATALMILSFGQLINVAMGSVTLLLNMSGFEHISAMGLCVTAVLNIALNAILIPLFGINGAAIATITSISGWNVLLAFEVYKKLNIHPTVLGVIELTKPV